MKMKILTVPNKLLYRQARPVEVLGPHLQALIDKMFITMYQAKGFGLAANQVGVLRQVIVLNMRYSPVVLINPVIYDMRDGVMDCEENCLSIPNFSTSITRARYVKVKSLNRYGKKQDFEASGLFARVIQHEVDHLRGRLINDV